MGKRRADAQPAARRALVGDLLLGIVQVGEDSPRRLEIGLALRVSASVRVERKSKRMPSRASIRSIARATADGLRSRRRPAAEKLPLSTTATNSAISRARSVPLAIFASTAIIFRVG